MVIVDVVLVWGLAVRLMLFVQLEVLGRVHWLYSWFRTSKSTGHYLNCFFVS